mgnify:CR=1 FL=1
MKKIIAWMLLSSKDPQKISLMIKGVLTGVVTYVVFFAGLFHINLAPTDINSVIEAIVKIIELLLSVVSVIATAWGLIRKLWTTATGKNKVINEVI